MAKRGVNKVILLGNLGEAPSYTAGANGGIINLSLATSESWVDKATQEKREKTEWHRCVAFRQLADIINNFNLEVGTQLYIEGRLQTRKWTDGNGQDRYTTEVVIDEFQPSGNRGGNNQQAPAQQAPAPDQQTPAPAQQAPAPDQQAPAPAQQSPIPVSTRSPAEDIDDIPF